MNRLPILMGSLLACALAALVAAASSPFMLRPSLVQASEPWPETRQAPDAQAEPARPRVGISAAPLQAALPAFFTDDEDAETNLRQLQIYYGQHSVKEVWDMHMAPLLAPGADKVQAAEPPYSPEELEAFRSQMDGFVVDLKDLLQFLPAERVLDMPEHLEQSRQVIAVASEEQLSESKQLYDQYPGYLDTPAYVLSVLQGGTTIESPGGIMPDLSLELPVRPNVIPPVPDEEIPLYPNCRLYGGHGTGDNGSCNTGCPKQPAGGLATVFALETAAFVNGAICEYIPKDIMIINTSIQNPFALLCTALRASFEIAAAAVKYANDLNGECESRYHRGIVNAYLDAEVSSRASQQSFNFYSARSLRLDMEDNLLDVLDDRVSTYQMPASQLGYLDAKDDVSVRYVVTDTIHMQELAGYTGEIHNAVDEYNAAETLRLAGDYKSAYARYRKAYRAVVRVGREP